MQLRSNRDRKTRKLPTACLKVDWSVVVMSTRFSSTCDQIDRLSGQPLFSFLSGLSSSTYCLHLGDACPNFIVVVAPPPDHFTCTLRKVGNESQRRTSLPQMDLGGCQAPVTSYSRWSRRWDGYCNNQKPTALPPATDF